MDLASLVDSPDVVDKRARSLRRKVMFETLKIRGFRGVRQYGKMFAAMWLYGLLEPTPSRILNSGYFWLRDIDDKIDGDKILHGDKLAYIAQKRELVTQIATYSLTIPAEEVDILLLNYIQLSHEQGYSLIDETHAILDAIEFDAKRSQTAYVPTQKELDDYFKKLDFACIEGAMKVAGDADLTSTAFDLSWAVRTWFNLRDFSRDLLSGIINIPVEDIARYGVELDAVKDLAGSDPSIACILSHKPLRSWYSDQLERGESSIEKAAVVIATAPYKGRFTRYALKSRFLQPAAHSFAQLHRLVSR